jgi:hypothetical protein
MKAVASLMCLNGICARQRNSCRNGKLNTKEEINHSPRAIRGTLGIALKRPADHEFQYWMLAFFVGYFDCWLAKIDLQFVA